MTVLTGLCLLVPAALAGPSINGSSGLIEMPTTETVQMGQIGAGLGIALVSAGDDLMLDGVPMGAAMGVTRRAELGMRVERSAWSASESTLTRPSGYGFHGSYRLVNPALHRAGFGVHAAMRSLQNRPAVEMIGLFQKSLAESDLHLAFGSRYGASRGLEWLVATGMSAHLPKMELVAEWHFTIGDRADPGLWLRAGSRVKVRSRLSAMPWIGGGTQDAQPWWGTGASLTLTSADPDIADRDRDEVPDAQDRCRYDAEDIDGFEDEDGCVDPDNDGDGIPDWLDETPDGVVVDELDYLNYPTPRFRLIIPDRDLPGPTKPNR